MRWQKRGLVFRPSEHSLFGKPMEFAQSPQALLRGEELRVYFSTRTRDEAGEYLSHVCFADFDRNFRSVIRVSSKPVVTLGPLGCFDEHGIFPMNVVERGSTVYGYTCGWSRRKSVPVETSIGLVVSTDRGDSFRRLGNGPILTSSLNEPFLVGDPFVRIYDDRWHMWYIYGTRWIEDHPLETAPARVYKIAHATSGDGRSWRTEGRRLIEETIGEDECQALPSVIRIGDVYHMYFCYRDAGGFRDDADKAYRIGYARSRDLETWRREDAAGGLERSSHGWDSRMLCYPHVFEWAGEKHILYNGNEFGRHGFGLATLVP